MALVAGKYLGSLGLLDETEVEVVCLPCSIASSYSTARRTRNMLW